LKGSRVQTLDSSDLHTALASLRARVAGKAVYGAKGTLRKLDEFADVLKNGVLASLFWGGDGLDSLSIEMLHGLILDLNKTTRFFRSACWRWRQCGRCSCQTSDGMTGFPVRTSFGRAFPNMTHGGSRHALDRERRGRRRFVDLRPMAARRHRGRSIFR